MRSAMQFVIATAFIALLPPAVAAETRDSAACRIGQIDRVYSDVKIVRDGTTLVPVAGEGFCARDRFLTGKRGIAALKFRDGTEVTVGKDSEFVIERWKERRLFANEAAFTLVKGAFRALTGAISERRHRFEVRTQVATIGVRGTEFWGGMNITPDALDVIMLSGKGVYIENEAGRVELTRPGEGTTVQAGKTPDAAKVWGEAKVQKAVATITP
ncbi:MAG: FecR family protein [Pseudomonadota bacterium]